MSSSHEGTGNVLREGTEGKLLGLLGFAARARKLVTGTDLCRDEVRRGRLPLVLVAGDASNNTKKRISDGIVCRPNKCRRAFRANRKDRKYRRYRSYRYEFCKRNRGSL